MALIRVQVAFDRSFSRPGQWILSDDQSAIRARFKLGEAPEIVMSARMRLIRPKREVPDGVWFSPIDAALTQWLSETSTFDGQVGVPLTLLLNNAPPEVAAILRRW